MPKIEDVIKDKIEKCDIFVADITPIYEFNNKLSPNPNVLIELGYALKAIGVNRIILVAQNHAQNQDKWDVKDLPFDINHHRILTFNDKSSCDLRKYITDIIEATNRKNFNIIKYLKSPYEWLLCKIKISGGTYKQANNGQSTNFPEIYYDSDMFFRQRIAYAFPGVRGVKWYTNIKDIVLHLTRLLHQPLIFSTSNNGGVSTPVWWFRSGSSASIENFKHISGRLFLVNNDEWVISRIAVFQDSGFYYKKEYVYVEIESQSPTSLGQISQKGSYSLGTTEEYGLLKWNNLFTFKITRHEYDDGGCIRFGRVLKGETQLRIRYLSKYNFLICAQTSSYNNHIFDRYSREYMDRLLDGTIDYDTFHKFLMKFPKPLYQ